MKIINAHVHPMKKDAPCLVNGNIDFLIKDMKEAGISASCLISSAGHGEYTDYTCGDYSMGELIEISKDKRFILIYFVDMDKNLDAQLKELEGLFKKNLVRGIKIELGYSAVMPDDSRLMPFYDLCEKYDYPAMFHTGDTLCQDARLSYSHPLNIDSLAVLRPKLKIIMAHAGNPWIMDAAAICYKNPNVYADVSGLVIDFTIKAQNNLVLDKLGDFIAYAGANKLLFGTDFPIIDSVSYVKFMKKLKIKKEHRELFFHGNAENLFKIK